jgi:hypothetical protein
MYRQSAFMLNRNMQLFTTWMAGTVHWDFSGAAVGATRRIAQSENASTNRTARASVLHHYSDTVSIIPAL